MKKIAQQVRSAERSVKQLSEQKKIRKSAKRSHGYDVKPNEIENKLQKKSVSKSKILKK